MLRIAWRWMARVASSSRTVGTTASGSLPPAWRRRMLSCLGLTPEVPSAFVCDMEALLNGAATADVTFVVDDTRIQAHRAILAARSEYFRAMLTSGFSEGQGIAHEISISDTTPEAFKALLRYLYTDELRFTDEHVLDVMRKARELSLERVYNHACRRVRGLSITVLNVAGWFVKADDYGLEDVLAATFGFLARNIRQVKTQARQSLQMLADKPHLLMEVMIESLGREDGELPVFLLCCGNLTRERGGPAGTTS
jgi:hypothetical protein